jgi:hypothetical protein
MCEHQPTMLWFPRRPEDEKNWLLTTAAKLIFLKYLKCWCSCYFVNSTNIRIRNITTIDNSRQNEGTPVFQ